MTQARARKQVKIVRAKNKIKKSVVKSEIDDKGTNVVGKVERNKKVRK